LREHDAWVVERLDVGQAVFCARPALADDDQRLPAEGGCDGRDAFGVGDECDADWFVRLFGDRVHFRIRSGLAGLAAASCAGQKVPFLWCSLCQARAYFAQLVRFVPWGEGPV
jgi:hypothetical protein